MRNGEIDGMNRTNYNVYNANSSNMRGSFTGMFTMYDGVICNAVGIGVANIGGNFTMYDGSIRNNGDGGVSTTNWNVGIFTMNGGAIYNNTTDGSGGGLRVEFGTFVMNGGLIHGNTARMNGGGLYLGRSQPNFTFNGGWVFDNRASNDNDFHLSQTVGVFNNNVFDPSVGAIGSPPPAR
jgi:hypothetical protein